MNQVNEIRQAVENFFDSNAKQCFPAEFVFTEENRNTFINIGTSIMCTEWEIGPKGGSFVQAVVNNDLMNAIGRADTTNLAALKFYCVLKYNIEMPESIAFQLS
jgi:hypothetical protein